jgi:peptide/nickel transport system permease protein
MGIVLLTSVVLLVVVSSYLISDERLATDLEARDIPPTLEHPFGTDWLGRDMLIRTIKGLRLSMGIGVLAAGTSVAIALVLGILAASGLRLADAIVSWLVDFFLGLPHLVFLILIAFVLGGGATAVVIGVALTHWPSLARVVRAEVLQLRTSDYIQASLHFGCSRWWIARKHYLPHLVPQLIVGFVMLVPHAILHEASITFLGFGLSPHRPAVGIILSEAMRYLSAGKWWLALMPGLALVLLVGVIFALGDNLRALLNPYTAHE